MGSQYNIEYSKKAKKSLDGLEKKIKLRILMTMQRYAEQPHTYAKRLKGTQYFRFRIGDHRVIADIQKGKLIILVIDIDHRKKIYKRFFG